MYSFSFALRFFILIAITSLLDFALWIGAMHLPPIQWISIYFYRGLCALALSWLPLMVIITRLLRLKLLQRHFMSRDTMPISIAASALMLAFFSLVPVVIDRSNSILILHNLELRSTPASEQNIKDEFVKVYISDWDQIGRRISEQMASGTIIKRDNGYVISDKGRAIMTIARLLAPLMQTDPRFINLDGAPARAKKSESKEAKETKK
jgi:hypothetical protein